MAEIRRRSLALALLFGLVYSATVIAVPSFSDQDFDSGYVNPGDPVVVQKIKIVNGSSTISSISIRNLGTAGDEDIKAIAILDSVPGEPIAIYETFTGLRSGLHLPVSPSYTIPNGTSYLWIAVVIADADDVSGGETIQLRVRFYSGDYTSDYITDGSPEEIFKGGFEEKEDQSPSAGFLNPNDANVVVQKVAFTDKDGGDTDELIGEGTYIRINRVLVHNMQDANQDDVNDVTVRVAGKVGGVVQSYGTTESQSAPARVPHPFHRKG